MYNIAVMDTIKIKIYNWLKKSEKYTKTDSVYVVKGFSWLMGGTIISSFIGLISAMAFAHYFSKENYGIYQYILSFVDIFGILALGGIDTAITRSTARGQEGDIKNGVITKIKWGLIGGFMSIVVGAYYLYHENSILGYSFIIAGIFIPFWEAPGIFTTYLQGKKRFDLLSIYDNAIQIMVTWSVIATLIITSSVIAVIMAFFTSYFIARLIFYKISFTKFPPNNIPDPELVPYGKHQTAISALGNFSANIDKILLWQLLGPAQVAIYVFAQAIPMRITGVTKIFNRLAFPKIASQDFTNIQKTLPKKIWLLFIPSLILTLLYMISAHFIFEIFFPQYNDAVIYTIVLSLIILLQPFTLIATSLSAQAKTRPLYIQNIISPIVRIILFMIFISSLGLMGAVISLVLSRLIDSVVIYTLFMRIKPNL